MKAIEISRRIGIDLLKGVAAALASFLGLLLGGMFTGWLNLPAPVIPATMNMTTLMPLMFVSEISIAVVLGECYRRLSWSFWPRVLALGISHYLLYYLLNLLDGLLFTPMPHMSTGIVLDLFPAFFAAAVIALLWRPEKGVLPVSEIMANFFSARQPLEWAWRMLVAWLIYPPLYYLIGRIAALFTLHYYQDPALNLGLTLPDLGTLLLMQVLRGSLFLVAVLPILFAWRGGRTKLWLWLGLVIFVQVANQIIVQAYWFPLGLRIPHALELLVDSAIQAGLYVWLLFLQPAGSPKPASKRMSPLGTGV
ncbi:MAG: hypothetical protein P8Z00_24070 [Anaerolineales bacterium]